MPTTNRANQISYATYCHLGGPRNSQLARVLHTNGTTQYHTYHYVGTGTATYRQDQPAGPKP